MNQPSTTLGFSTAAPRKPLRLPSSIAGLALWALAALMPQIAHAGATTTTLVSSANPVVVGVAHDLTATVTGVNPTGNVTFKSGSTTIGTVALSGTGNSRTAVLSSYLWTTAGTKSLTAVYAGDGGNTTSTSSALSQTVSKATATASMTSATNPVGVGASSVLTATVTGYNPTGNVTFKSGTTTLGTVALSGTGNTRTATYTATFTAVSAGASLTAVYAGDTNNLTVTSSAVSQVVNIQSTTTALTADKTSATLNSDVTFTATVTGYNPSGNVAFKNGATTLGTIALSGTGNTRTATYVNRTLAVGSYNNITAVYAGNSTNTTSTSAAAPVLAITAAGAATSTAVLTSATNPTVAGGSTLLTATVTGTNPTGQVSFKSGSTVVGTAQLTGTGNTKTATYTYPLTTVSTVSLTAAYVGDAVNQAKTSSAVSQVTNKAPTTSSVTSSLNPAAAGASITFTATVTGYSPSGNVAFLDNGATTLTTVATTGTGSTRTAVYTTSALSNGPHNITVAYAGNTTDLASASSAIPQSVGQTPTTTALVASPRNITSGDNVTLTATVSGTSPTGSVTFLDGATTLSTVPLSGNTAMLPTTALSAGARNITARYVGDGFNATSTSAVAVVSVTARPALVYQYGYDAMGRPTIAVDPNGQTTTVYYDSLGRPIQKQEPANVGAATPTITSATYDLADNVTKVTDPRNLDTTYSPNGLGQVTAQTSPDTGTGGFTYDAIGNLKTKTDARGKVTTYGYDVRDRLTSISYPTGTATTLEYDGGTTPYAGAKGEHTKITDESGSQTYTFDAAGRLTAKTQVTGTKTFTVSYTWGNTGSATDKLTSITYPSGNRVNYSYDSTGQLAGVSVNPVNTNGVGTSGSTPQLLNTLTTTVDGAPKGWVWGNSLAHSLGYDSYGQLIAYPLGNPAGSGIAAGQLRTISRDAAGRITGFVHTNNATPTPALDQSYTYDNLNRVLSGTANGVTTQYSYDATGNRTAKIINATTYTNTVSPTSNRLTQTQDVTGTANPSYDAAGNITNDGANTYTYSDRGRMSSATTGLGTISYAYNALEQRVSKTGPAGAVPTGAAYYVYDEAGNLLGEYDAAGTPIYETVYLGASQAALPVGVMKLTGTAGGNNLTNNLYNVYADHINTPRIITRPSDNAIVWRWDTAEAFGATTPDQNPNAIGTFTFNQRFPGQVFDAETGLNQNWNRDYDARQGRYRQSDPIGLAGGINTYSYVSGAPVGAVDPLGLVDMNMFAPGTSHRRWADDIQSPPGTYTVAGHGNPQIMENGNRQPIFPKDLAEMIKNDPSARGKTIVLYACNVGNPGPNGQPSFAEQLSKLLNQPVAGPDNYIWYTPNGISGIFPIRPFPMRMFGEYPDRSNPGGMRLYK